MQLDERDEMLKSLEKRLKEAAAQQTRRQRVLEQKHRREMRDANALADEAAEAMCARAAARARPCDLHVISM